MSINTFQLIPARTAQPHLPPPLRAGATLAQVEAYLRALRTEYLEPQRVQADSTYNLLARTIVELRMVGTASSLPAAGVPGRSFFATDTGIGYADTGSAWQVQPTAAGVQAVALHPFLLMGAS